MEYSQTKLLDEPIKFESLRLNVILESKEIDEIICSSLSISVKLLIEIPKLIAPVFNSTCGFVSSIVTFMGTFGANTKLLQNGA